MTFGVRTGRSYRIRSKLIDIYQQWHSFMWTTSPSFSTMDGQVCVDWNYFISWCIAGQLSISVILLLVGLLPWIPAMWFLHGGIACLDFEYCLFNMRLGWSNWRFYGLHVQEMDFKWCWWRNNLFIVIKPRTSRSLIFRRCMQLILLVKNIVMKHFFRLFICYSFFYSLLFLCHVFLFYLFYSYSSYYYFYFK